MQTEINQKIFKSYDIRGIYPDELNENVAYLVGRAFARKAKAKEIVVGFDMRLSGPPLKENLIKGITDEGVDVVDIGLVSIDVVYFSVGILKYPAGIMVTASHNPPEYNGFKMTLKNMEWVRGETLKDEVLSLPAETSSSKGKVKQVDILPKYINRILSFVDVQKVKPFTVVVDAGNGMAGKIMPMLEKHLPVKIIPLNFKLDGSFPSHPSNPLLPESHIQITKEVKKRKADFGVIFDGDTDRVFFIDETGRFIRGDITLLLLAKEYLKREPGAGIAYNLICSKIVPEKIKEWGGRPIRTKTGFVNVTSEMRKHDCVLGGEVSTHYAFRDSVYSDSGFIPFLMLLQLISEEGRSFSEVVNPFYKYFKAPEENLELKDRSMIEGILKKFEKEYKDGRQDRLDGLTVEYNDWWFNVRPSNTEPLLRITVEAESQKLLAEKLKELVDLAKE